MAKKKKASSKAANNKTKSTNKLQTTLITQAIISLLVVVVCFAYLGLLERPAISQTSVEVQAQSLADSQVSLLDQALNQLRLRLSNIALSNELLTAFNDNDQPVIKRYQKEMVRAFPEATSVKLIPLGPLGIASLSKENLALLGHIERDLLSHISNGETVEPEAYNAQNKWQFSLAEPVKSADIKYSSGALLVTLDEQYLKTLLSQLDSTLGQTTLIQQFKNKQHIIATAGNSGGDFTASSDASVSHWQIVFAPSSELIASSSHSANLIWILLAVAAIAMVAASMVAHWSLLKALATDLEKLVKNSPKKQAFTLPGFADVADQLQAKAAKVLPVEKIASEPDVVAEPISAEVSSSSDLDLPESIPDTIFRAYDIRGIAEEQLTDQIVYAIGLAIGSEALDQGQQTVVVCADGRHSSPRIRDAMTKGLLASGRDVIDIGILPTPLMYFATHQLGTQSGVMITGSHNPAEYNGIKIVIGGRALSDTAIQALRDRIINKDLASGQGELQTQNIKQSYIDYIINDVAIAQPLKVVIDAGNGVAGAIAPQLLEELGCEIIQLYCEVDGNFPNHHPDPSVEANLEDLKRVVQEQQADLGVAFDGDGDRIGVVTATGKSVPADRLLMLLAQDVVSRNPGADVLFDVKCTRNLNTLISNYGGRPIMWKTGHSYMKEKMAETGALLGGEFSGHIFFKERWFGFDDGIYAAARLIEILSTSDPDLDLQLEAFPASIGSPELKVESTEEQKFSIIEQLVNTGDFGDGKVSTLDGVRVDFPDGWGLVRASNTTPLLILRFEADTEEAMLRIQNQFKEQLSNVDSSLQFGF
ncbi:MAG: phosphomannomutase/phosphoglucomutase [Pseudomonadales bacterium]